MLLVNRKVGIVKEYQDCGPIELSLPNSRISFFNECLTQRFFSIDLCQNSTTVHIDPTNNMPIQDTYSNPNSYQSHCMDLSKELMTFAVGGPRFFQNNTLLENSSLWVGRNLAKNIHCMDTFRDCKYVYGSPLFRHLYEFSTNPAMKGDVVNDPENWWEIVDRHKDIFEDANDFGYVATQLSHLPHCIGYDCGNLMSFLPVYDVNLNMKCNIKLRQNSRSVHLNFFQEARNKFFNDRSDSVVVGQ